MGTALGVDTVFQTRTPGYFEHNTDIDFETFQLVPKSRSQGNKEKIVGHCKHRNNSALKTRRSDQNQCKGDHKQTQNNIKPKRNNTYMNIQT